MRLHWSVLFLPLLLIACGDRDERVAAPPPMEPPAQAETDVVPEPAPPPMAECNAERAESAIGQVADEALLARARDEAGAETARFLRPGEAVTMEYVGSRLNLELDEYETVVAVRCG